MLLVSEALSYKLPVHANKSINKYISGRAGGGTEAGGHQGARYRQHEGGGARRFYYSIYLLYWYKSTNTDAGCGQLPPGSTITPQEPTPKAGSPKKKYEAFSYPRMRP